MDLNNFQDLKNQLKAKKAQLSLLQTEIEELNIQIQEEKAKIEADLYGDDEGEILPIKQPEVVKEPDPTQALNPRLKAFEEMNKAIQTSIEKKFKIINGKRHVITEEWIGKKPEGGFVNMGGIGDDFS